MQIHFFATLRQITGCKTVELPIAQGTTVRQLVDVIVEHYPPMRRELLDEAGDLWPHVHVLVNGRDAQYLAQGLQTPVKHSDVINVFPAVGGGA